MERLTFEGNFCDIAQCWENPCPYNGSCSQREVWEKLKSYEDTGLEPEKIEAMKNAMMGKAIAEIKEFDGVPVDRLWELVQAEQDGRLRIMHKSERGTCGSCAHFAREPGKRAGTCDIRDHYKNRWGQDDVTRGRFRPSQSRKGCKKYQPREEAEAALEAQKGGGHE